MTDSKKSLINMRGIIAVLLPGLMILAVCSCNGVKRQQVIQHEPGWVLLEGAGTRASYAMKPKVSNDKMLLLSVGIDGFVQEIIMEDSRKFQKISIPKAGFMEVIGKPNLPVIRKLVAVPPGRNIRVRLIDPTTVIKQNYNIYPAQRPVVEEKGGPYRTPFTIDQEFYKTSQYYPKSPVSISKPMKLGRQTVVQLEVFPIQYNPVLKTLKVLKNAEVEINFIDDSRTGNLIKVPTSPAMWKQYKHLVNIDWIKDYLLPLPDADYLFITADQFAEEIAPLAAWKKTKGFRTRIVKMSSIGTTDDDVRDYISRSYHSGKMQPAYVLLVGDVEHVPTHIYDSDGLSCASDLYYATVDGNDFLPDLAIGRFSAKTEDEVTGMVAKSIAYEKTPVTDPYDWYSQISLISDEGYFEVTSDWIHTFMTDRGYDADRFYRSLGTATTVNISNATNDGRVILQYRGHGGVTGWSTGSFHNANVLALTNGWVQPVVFSPTCQTGWFDHDTLDCFGETWLKAGGVEGNNGGVAFWGSSRNSYGGYNDQLAMGTYKAAFDDGLSSFGDITNQAKLYMFGHYGASSMCQLEFNLFNVLGDPELNVWFQIPTVLPEGWNIIDLDILGSNRTGGITKEIMTDVGGQNAFPVLTFPGTGSPSCFVTFSVPSDWDGVSDMLVEYIWYSPNQAGNMKWSMVYDRKDASQTPFDGFNRHVKYFWGIRKEKVNHSINEIWSLTNHGAINPGDVITLGLERFAFNPNEDGAADAITDKVHLIAARILYRAID